MVPKNQRSHFVCWCRFQKSFIIPSHFPAREYPNIYRKFQCFRIELHKWWKLNCPKDADSITKCINAIVKFWIDWGINCTMGTTKLNTSNEEALLCIHKWYFAVWILVFWIQAFNKHNMHTCIHWFYVKCICYLFHTLQFISMATVQIC